MIAVALFGFTLSYDEFARTALLTGQGNTLPVEMVAVQSVAPRPSLYAVGSMTTALSLAVIFLGFAALYLIQRRRAGLAGPKLPVAEHYGDTLGSRSDQRPAE